MQCHLLIAVLIFLEGSLAKMLLVETQGKNNTHKGYLLKTNNHDRGLQNHAGLGRQNNDRGVQKIVARKRERNDEINHQEIKTKKHAANQTSRIRSEKEAGKDYMGYDDYIQYEQYEDYTVHEAYEIEDYKEVEDNEACIKESINIWMTKCSAYCEQGLEKDCENCVIEKLKG